MEEGENKNFLAKTMIVRKYPTPSVLQFILFSYKIPHFTQLGKPLRQRSGTK
jgi:hypothetical protein